MTEEYSVWLVPEEDSQEMEELDNMISEYAQEYSTPDFKPHVTIVGGIEEDLSVIKEKVRELSEGLNPLELSFQPPHFSTTRHQCNYLLVEPTEKLLRLKEDLRKSLEYSNSMYVPHLSLIYSDMELSDRKELHDSLGNLPNGFRSDRIVIFDTTGGEKDWHLVEEFKL